MRGCTRRQRVAQSAMIVLAGVAVYYPSFRVPFVFDDLRQIVNNPALHQLWPPWGWLASTRPLVYLTLALNYAFGGLSAWGYHAVNVGLHVAAALLVADLGRLVLEAAGGAWRSRASWLGWWAGVIFAVHPLQTESVTYVVSRTELLMSFWYLATVNLALRSFRVPGRRRWWLRLTAIICCALGMASKEVMVTAPVMVVWLSLCLAPGGWRERLSVVREHWIFYLGLAGTWAVLGYLFSTGTYVGVGPGVGISPGQYLATQWGVIVHYLRLYVWPSGLTLDYAWPVADSWMKLSVLLPMLVILSIVAVAIRLLQVGQGVWSLWIGWVFGILIPTSTVYPIADVMFEHRMYLSVAGLAMLTVMAVARLVMAGGRPLALRAAASGGLVIVALLGGTTVARNRVWQDPVALWQDTAAKRPGNARAHYTVGTLLADTDRLDEAAASLRRAIEIDPGYANAHTNLGNVLMRMGRLDEAIEQYEAALKLRPDSAEDHGNLGNALLRQGRMEEAAGHLKFALLLRPELAESHNNLGILLAKTGAPEKAIPHFRAALKIRPDFLVARRNLAAVLSLTGAHEEAIKEYKRLLAEDPRNPDLYFQAAIGLVQAGRRDEAVDLLRQGLGSVPNQVQLSNYLAWLLATSPDPGIRNAAEAVKLAEAAAGATNNRDPNTLDTLAAAYAEAGRFKTAVQTAQQALKLAQQLGQSSLAGSIATRISLYESGRAYRED